MPNWCMNDVHITGPEDKIRALAEAAKKGELLNYMVPQQKDDPEWYSKNINAWGTKWDVSETEADVSEDGKELFMSFYTAWSPPNKAFETYSENNPDVSFTVKYFEPGMGFAGVFDFNGEYFDDACFTEDEDGDEYKEFISKNFGWEEEEEDEE